MITGGYIRARIALKGKREEMEEIRVGKRQEEKETHRRDAANAVLEIMKIAPNNDNERKHLIKHYEMAYVEMLGILRAPEKQVYRKSSLTGKISERRNKE